MSSVHSFKSPLLLLHPALYAGKLNCTRGFSGLPCPVAASWVWPVGSRSRQWEGEKGHSQVYISHFFLMDMQGEAAALYRNPYDFHTADLALSLSLFLTLSCSLFFSGSQNLLSLLSYLGLEVLTLLSAVTCPWVFH